MPRSVSETTPRGHPHKKRKKAVVTTVRPSGKITGGTKKSRANARSSQKRVRRITAPSPKPTYVRPGTDPRQQRSSGRGSAFHPSDVASKAVELTHFGEQNVGLNEEVTGKRHPSPARSAVAAATIALPVEGLAAKGLAAGAKIVKAEKVAQEAKAVGQEAKAVEKAAAKAAKREKARPSEKITSGTKRSRARARKRLQPKARNRGKVRVKRAAKDRYLKTGTKEGRQVTRRERLYKSHQLAPFAGTGAGGAAAAAVAADIQGQVTANPLKAAKRTVELAPAMVTSTADLVGQGVHALTTGDTKGLEKRLKKDWNFNKHMAEVLTSGDPERVKSLTEKQVGYLPALMGRSAVYGGANVVKALRDKPGKAPPREGIAHDLRPEPPKVRKAKGKAQKHGLTREQQKTRRQISRDAARERDKAVGQTHKGTKPIAKAYEGNVFGRLWGIGKKGIKKRRKARRQPVDAGDAATWFAENGINQGTSQAALEAAVKKERARPGFEHEHGVTAHDIIDYMEQNNGKMMDDPQFWEVVRTTREGLAPNQLNDIVGLSEQAKAHDVPLIPERVPHAERIGGARTWEEQVHTSEQGKAGRRENVEKARREEGYAGTGKGQARRNLDREKARVEEQTFTPPEGLREETPTPTASTDRYEISLEAAKGSLRNEKGKPGVSIEGDYAAKFDMEVPGIKNVVHRDANGNVDGMLTVIFEDTKATKNSSPISHMNIVVAKGARRQGIATEMAQAAHEAGFRIDKVAPQESFTAEGAALREGLRGKNRERTPTAAAERDHVQAVGTYKQAKKRHKEARKAVRVAEAEEKRGAELARRAKVNAKKVAEGKAPKMSPEKGDAIAAEFRAEMAKIHEEHGLDPGVWVPHTDVGAPVGPRGANVEPPMVRGGKAIHPRGFGPESLAERGRVDYSLEKIVNVGVAAPHIRKAIHRLVKRTVSERARKIPVLNKRSGRWEDRRLITREEFNRAPISDAERETLALFPLGQFNQAIKHGDTETLSDMAVNLAREADWRDKDPGRKYVAMDRDAVKELMAQVAQPSGGLQTLQHGSRGISRAILASPAWEIGQMINEPLQLAQAINPLNPVNWYHAAQGIRGYRAASEATKENITSTAGHDSGFTGSPKDYFTADGRSATHWLEGTNRLMRVLPIRMLVKAARLDWLSAIDRSKTARLGQGAALIKAHKDAYGFGVRLQRLITGQRALNQKIKAMTPTERIELGFKNTPERRKVENYLDDIRGNWRALSRHEKVAAPMLIFYPFLRMGLQWPFHTFPKHHPIRAGIMYDLAASHNEQLRQLAGGSPSFFTDYATALIYGNKPGTGTAIPFQRFVPGANTILQAASLGFGPQTIQTTNPFVGWFNALFQGIDPLSGDKVTTDSMSPEEQMLARLGLAANLAFNTLAPARAADTLKGAKPKTSLPLIGERYPKSALGDLIEKISGTPEEKATGSFLQPVKPMTFAKYKDQQTLYRIFSYWRKYGTDAQDELRNNTTLPPATIKKQLKDMVARYDEANNELSRLFAKYNEEGQASKDDKAYEKRQAKINPPSSSSSSSTTSDSAAPGWEGIGGGSTSSGGTTKVKKKQAAGWAGL